MLVREAIEDYSFVILRHAPRTQSWYLSTLNEFPECCEQENPTLGEIKQKDIRLFLESVRKRTNPHTGEPLSSYTVHGYSRTVNSFLSWRSRKDGIEEFVSEKLSRRMDMPRLRTPAFKLRWGAQPGVCPQQRLLLKAIAMFERVASPIAQSHLRHAGIRLAIPQKPTLARVAGPICGSMTQDTDDRHFEWRALDRCNPVHQVISTG